QYSLRFRRETFDKTRRVPGVLLQKVVDEHRNVFATLAQRRHINRKNIDSIIEIVTKTSITDHRAQIPVGGGDHTNINWNFEGAAHAANAALLQSAQEFRLHADVEFRNLIEKQRAAIRNFEQTFLLSMRAGE